MENASHGCVKTSNNNAILSKPSGDDCKVKFVSPYVNKPIFRRKLIEKYSTARYNINTKRVLVRKSASQTTCNDKVSKVSPQNASSSIKNDENPENGLVTSTGLSNDDLTSAMAPRTRKSAKDEALSNNFQSNVKHENSTTSETAINDETPCCKNLRSPTVSCPSQVSPNIQQDASASRKRKFNSTPSSSIGSKAAWKIAPKSVYNQLWDLYQSTVEIKTEEPKKETKKKKCAWTKKRSRRKPITCLKNLADKIHLDPYVECMKETETQSENASSNQNSEKLGIVMYLGVERPLFPLIYKNLRVLNDSNDATITDFWSEFSLSTLITKIEDKKCKPILVPVKDPELIALVSECVEEANVSSSKSVASDDDQVKNETSPPQVRVKQEENEVPEKKSKYKLRSLNSEPKVYGLRVNPAKKVIEKEPEKSADVKPITPVRVRASSPAPILRPFTPTPNLTLHPTPCLTPPPPILSPALSPIPAPAPAPVPAPAPALAATPKSKNRAIRSKGRFDEKAILKKFGYKECQVAIPKLSDTLIKYLSAGNYSNESAQLSDPTERELIEETDDFGLIQCTRTDGIIIDYVKRNRSLVYFYKLKKMLDFQKTNNKYFVCCDYMLIDRSDADEGDGYVDIMSIQENDDDNDDEDATAATTSGPRSSRNPNDLFKSSKISEWKNKSYNISWVKNHDLKEVDNVKWLLISLDNHIASLSHANGCVLRYRLLFEIIYRAELSKKVICCEISNASSGGGGNAKDSASDKLTFGVYAFPGLCDKLLAGPYLYHEEHQLSANIRTSNGSSEHAHIRTLEEKENFPQTDDSAQVKHINAKWWSGKKTGDLTEQYLNFFFNPSIVKCIQPTDKLCLSKIIEDHPCHNYHSYQVTGRESNLVLFHDRTNAIEKTFVAPIEPSVVVETNDKSDQKVKVAAPTVLQKQSRNLRKKPRRDYSQLVTDDMVVPARTKNLEFHIVDVKSLRKRRRPREVHEEMQPKMKRNRYQESPHTHIINERMRRLEFRNRKNNLASVLEARPTTCNNNQSLVSILAQSREIIAYLEVDNSKLDEEGKRLRAEQSTMMRRFLALLRSLDINSREYKRGIAFAAAWKQIKANHRNKLIDILGQNFDKQKTTRVTESSRNSHTSKEPISTQRSNIRRPVRRPLLISKRSSPEKQTTSGDEDMYEFKEDYPVQSKADGVVQRLKLRKKERQKMRNVLRKRNHFVESGVAESVECEISEEVVCEDGKLSNPLSCNHILERGGEVPITISNVPSNVDPYAIDPLADDNSNDASSLNGDHSSSERREPSHPLYVEHSYCCVNGKPPNNSSKLFDRSIPQIRSLLDPSILASRYRVIRPLANTKRPTITNTMSLSNGYRPIRPILNHSSVMPQQRRNSTRVRNPIATAAATSPAFQIRVNKSAEENLGIDILDNGRMFARLNIAKVNNGSDTNNVASSSCGVTGAAGASTSSKIMNIIQRFLLQMDKASPSIETNDDERAKQAKRKHVVNSLKSFISKFENRKKPVEDAGYSSSRTSNSDDTTSPPYVTDNIELESGYSSKSEESCDRDHEFNTNEPKPTIRNPITNSQAIENIVLDDDDDDDDDDDVEVEESQENEIELELEKEIEKEVEKERVIREDEFIAEEEEEEEIVGEEEFIEEEEEEEEIVGDSNTQEEMNDVDAAMRVDENDRFADSDDDAEDTAVVFVNQSENDENTSIVQNLEIDQSDLGNGRLVLPKSTPKVLYTTNQFTIIRSKDKFIPNIMKTPTKAVVDTTSAADHLSRIQIKPSIGSLVKLSAASLKLTTNATRQTISPTKNDSIIKRLWYSPVTKADQTDLKILRRESPLNEPVKIGQLQSGKSANEDAEQENSNDDTEPSIEKDNSGANRILIKSFANHTKFQEAFLSNVDRLLNPES